MLTKTFISKNSIFSEKETKLNLETEIKLDNLKELLKKGYSLRDAIRKVGVGWKTYYQYKIYVLIDPEVPLPKKRMKRLIERWFPHKIDARTLFILLWSISRYTAKELLIRKRRRQLYAREFNQFRKIADELMMKWSYELAQGFFNH